MTTKSRFGIILAGGNLFLLFAILNVAGCRVDRAAMSKDSSEKDVPKAERQELYLANDEKNIDEKDEYGKIPLHGAAGCGNEKMVKFLIEKGAKVDTKDQFGRTPLHEAARNGNKEVVELFLEKGANVNIKDEQGRTPLHESARNGNKEVVEFLIDKGANVDEKDKDSRTPLHEAARNWNKELKKFLLDKGAKVDEKDKDGRPPLHEAARNRNKEMVALLLEKGAKVDEKDNDGRIPLHEAAEKGYEKVVELLLVKGASVDEKDNTGRKPFDEVVASEKSKFVKLFITHKKLMNMAHNNNDSCKLDVSNMVSNDKAEEGSDDFKYQQAACPSCEGGYRYLYTLGDNTMILICEECNGLWMDPTKIDLADAVGLRTIRQELFDASSAKWSSKEEIEKSKWADLAKKNEIFIRPNS